MEKVSVYETDSSKEVITKHSNKYIYYETSPNHPKVRYDIYTESRKVIYVDKFVIRKIIYNRQYQNGEESKFLNVIKVRK